MKRFFPNYKKCVLATHSSLRDALSTISRSGALMACVVSETNRLIGILTDSDIRKALLCGASLDDDITPWININPICGAYTHSDYEILKIATTHAVREIPILDDAGNLVDVFIAVTHDQRIDVADNLEIALAAPIDSTNELPNSMLLLAGGKGTRLRQVVHDRPKPLAVVGDRPILETIIQRAALQGIRRFYISVNYMAEKIEEHLTQDVYKGLEFHILREKQFLGTAGCLGLIKDPPKHPIIVANADILANLNYASLLEHHRKENASMTCVVRQHQTIVPFGVVTVHEGYVTGVVEKPSVANLVNTGIYVLNTDIVSSVKSNEYMDMPELITGLTKRKELVSAFFLHEYWRDIGRPDDFLLANSEYHLHFGSSENDI